MTLNEECFTFILTASGIYRDERKAAHKLMARHPDLAWHLKKLIAITSFIQGVPAYFHIFAMRVVPEAEAKDSPPEIYEINVTLISEDRIFAYPASYISVELREKHPFFWSLAEQEIEAVEEYIASLDARDYELLGPSFQIICMGERLPSFHEFLHMITTP